MIFDKIDEKLIYGKKREKLKTKNFYICDKMYGIYNCRMDCIENSIMNFIFMVRCMVFKTVGLSI